MKRIIADLHIHSKYAMATSRNSDLEGLSKWAEMKGIDILCTGDATHPRWFSILRESLTDLENGLYSYKKTKFILGSEVSLIYEREHKTKKMHILFLSPSFDHCSQINDELSRFGNLSEDGRPTLKLDPSEFIDIVKGISQDNMAIPAHVWTPWFSLFGSRSGVDAISEAFGKNSKKIDALETGLSSDPMMNWMLSSLDDYSLVSNSDAHSPQKIGREANVFECGESYFEIMNAIRSKDGFVETLEFYPEEGKYHYDGHRKCGVVLDPESAEKHENKCPKCGRKLTIGVLHRVLSLSDRKMGCVPKCAVGFKRIIPLIFILSKSLGRGENTLSVKRTYFNLVDHFGTEFNVLLSADTYEIEKIAGKKTSDIILAMRSNRIKWKPGYDGVFGEIEKIESERSIFEWS